MNNTVNLSNYDLESADNNGRKNLVNNIKNKIGSIFYKNVSNDVVLPITRFDISYAPLKETVIDPQRPNL
jgi:hypothetical protein